MIIYRYFLISITIFALYQLLFFYLIRPYYYNKLVSENLENFQIPEVAFEVVYLLILILGLVLAPLVDVTPYFLWGVIFLVYGLAIKKSPKSFFLATALIFKFQRNLNFEKQMQYQANIIFSVCLASSIIFLILGYII